MARYACVFAALLTLMAATSAQAGLLYSSNFNANNGGMTYINYGGSASNPWTYNTTGGVSNSGAWRVNGNAGLSDKILMSAGFVSNGGTVTLSFDHRFNFETSVTPGVGFDGGAVFASINGGNYNYVAGSSFTQNGYTHTISSSFGSTLGGLGAFSGGSSTSAFITSIATLGVLNAGDTVSFLFLGSWDSSFNSTGDPDWVIDNVSLFDTGVPGAAVPAPPTVLLGLIGIAFTGAARWRRLRWAV